MDTKLGSFSVEIPHYVVESSVEYRTIRRPTVFESMALKLISEFQRHEVMCAQHGRTPAGASPATSWPQ